MNVTEMHIAVSQGVDKINSLQADMLLPEEIDIELNKSQMRFINTKYGKNNIYQKGFEESQKRIDDLRTLVVEADLPAVYKEQATSTIWIDTVVLPNDYMYLVNQRSRVVINNCEALWDKDGILSSETEVGFFTINPTTFVLGDNTTIVQSIFMYADITDSSVGQAIVWENTEGYQYPQDISSVITSILAADTPGFSTYWESYGMLNFPGEIIIVVDTSVHSWFNSINGATPLTPLVGVDSMNNIITSSLPDTSFAVFNSTRVPSAYSETVISPNKFIQQDDIFTLLEDPFNTTKYNLPITTIRQNSIDIYTSDIFIIDSVKLTYLKEPAQISLSLQVSCELPDHSHSEIVDMAVSSILESIADTRYATHQKEVIKNE